MKFLPDGDVIIDHPNFDVNKGSESTFFGISYKSNDKLNVMNVVTVYYDSTFTLDPDFIIYKRVTK